ncbi:YsnF/AvaK domain-containing protein [Lichenihabitans psoromatis]|uniref:YsnF/AvaK domain-containing protein n=1 Tax=Lichenihabitans psoromatis TaxID=2528642 RepID=UPI0010363E49|nr:YsnF/AvaK domain-containing protein [Lichenihabitans psoromatis]
MSDVTKEASVDPIGVDRNANAAGLLREVAEQPDHADGDADLSQRIPLIEETFSVSKQSILTGKVRVSTRTEGVEALAEVTLERSIVDVSRVPVGRIVDEAPSVRTEGDTTIVPVLEERFVIVKQLYLVEELHIRHRVEQDVSTTPVSLRRQTAIVERYGPDGVLLIDPITDQ